MTDGAGVIGAGPVRGRAARAAVRAGLNHGWIELSHCFTMLGDALEILPFTLISALLLLVAGSKHVHVPGSLYLIGSTLLAGMLGMNVGFNGITSLGMQLTAEREDSTLLRAKATPNGMLGYLIGKIVSESGTIMFTAGSQLIVGLALFSGLVLGSATSWLTPSWLQWVGQAFPLYWLGLGVRSALLPGNLAAVEIGHSWRHLAMAGVLGPWAIAGLVLPRSCCAVWHAARPDRAWPPGGSGS